MTQIPVSEDTLKANPAAAKEGLIARSTEHK